MATTPTLISVRSAVERTGLSEHTIRAWIRTGKLRAYKVGKWRISLVEADIEALIQPRPVKTSKSA